MIPHESRQFIFITPYLEYENFGEIIRPGLNFLYILNHKLRLALFYNQNLQTLLKVPLIKLYRPY